jgi:hypothetical protein
MAKLSEQERAVRRTTYRNRYMASTTFAAKRAGTCTACGRTIPEGSPAAFRFFEGVGAGYLVHADCVNVGTT